MAEILEFVNVSFGYGSSSVLQDISHRFSQGCLTVICCPNGSGKSTLFRVASDMARPKNGMVRLGSSEVASIPARSRARQKAMLPQAPVSSPELLVRDIVALGRYAYRKPFRGLCPEDRAAINDAMEATGTSDLSTVRWPNCRVASASAHGSP